MRIIFILKAIYGFSKLKYTESKIQSKNFKKDVSTIVPTMSPRISSQPNVKVIKRASMTTKVSIESMQANTQQQTHDQN